MLLTQEQAAETWCPHIRVPAQFNASRGNVGAFAIAATSVNVTANPLAENAMTRNAPGVACIGSKCSQWRWASPPTDMQLRVIPDLPMLGYCGLAGRPQ